MSFAPCKQFTNLVIFCLQGVFLFFVFSYEPVRYGENYVYPKWGEYLGLAMSGLSMMWIPLYMIYYVLTEPGTLMEVSFVRFYSTQNRKHRLYNVRHRTTNC